MHSESFPLARMNALILGVTVVLFPLPLIFLAVAFLAPRPIGLVFQVVTLFLFATWAAIWLIGRPTRFEVSPAGVRVVWPVREQLVPESDVASADLVTSAEFRKEFGYAMRVGAGGLWGGFGWAWTGKGMLGLYVSRTDGLVLLRCREGRSMLITPADPERFVAAVARMREIH